jgi:uncharacterized protein (UPF0548 family)
VTEATARERAFLARLGAAHFTYRELGGSLAPVLPPGYRHLHRCWMVGHGTETFRRARGDVLDWQLQRRAGLRVTATSTVAQGCDVVLGFGVGRRARLLFGCRVVTVLDEDTRAGFAYGTLPGHPERGEEAFVVEHLPDGRVTLSITAFSAPGTWWAHVTSPVNRTIQNRITERYGRALATVPG